MGGATSSSLKQAMAAHQINDLAGAELLYRTHLKNTPDDPDACALLGIVVGARGEFVEAVEWVNRAVSLDPTSGILHFHQGTVLMAAQQLPEAIAALKRALAINPHVPQIHFNLANGLRAMSEWKEAIAHYRIALRLDPRSAPTYNNLALSLVYEKQFEEALTLAQQAVALNPAYGDGWVTLCNVADNLKNYDLAITAGKKAITVVPENHYAWFGYGLALNRLERHEEAIEIYKHGLALNPNSDSILDNLAQTYQSLNRLEEAETTYHQAIKIAKQAIHDEKNREVDENEYGNRHWHLALMELLRGKYSQGFARYRSRVIAIKELKRLSMPFPLWKGEDLKGKTLLVCDEQGYGDTLMMARFLPLLRAQGVRIVFSVHKVLVPLFQGWAGADFVIQHNGMLPPCDYFCSSFDLPHRMGTTLENLPRDTPYLPLPSPDPSTSLPPTSFKIGVVWGGSPLHLNDAKRSIPLSVFADLFSIPGITFYSFNRDLKDGDELLLPKLAIETVVPLLTDFSAAARLIAQMDMIITCDTATAHLAGGMGKVTWTLLPFAPDWRWLTDRSDSPWYPHMRLFRQPKTGDWTSVIAEVKRALQLQMEVQYR